MRDFNSNGLIDKNEIFDWFIAAEKIRKSKTNSKIPKMLPVFVEFLIASTLA